MSSSPLTPNETGKHFVEFVRDERDLDREIFDRLHYASHLLKILSPRALTVALCPGTERLRVEQGAELGDRAGGRWAIVSIPPQASRVHIALTLAKLAGREADPYMLDVLLRARPT